MNFLMLPAFLMCFITLILPIYARPWDSFTHSAFNGFSGNFFGEGSLKPGYDQGAGYFSELDAPSLSVPNNQVFQGYV